MRKRCYVCRKTGGASTMVDAVFTKDQDKQHGHRGCFEDCNRDLAAMGEPWRWKLDIKTNEPSDKINILPRVSLHGGAIKRENHVITRRK